MGQNNEFILAFKIISDEGGIQFDIPLTKNIFEPEKKHKKIPKNTKSFTPLSQSKTGNPNTQKS